MRCALWLVAVAVLGLYGTAPGAQSPDAADDDGFISAQTKVAKAKEDMQNAYDVYKKAKAAEHVSPDRPPPSPQERAELQQATREAARLVTERTLDATKARKELQQIESQRAARQPSPANSAGSNSTGTHTGAADSAGSAAQAPAINPLQRLNLKLGRTFSYLQESNAVLQDAATKGLPAMTRPEVVPDPFETAWKRYQDRYDSRATAPPTPPTPPTTSTTPPTPTTPTSPPPDRKEGSADSGKPAMSPAEYERMIDAYERDVAAQNREAGEFRTSLLAVRADQAAGRAEIDRFNAAVQAFNALPEKQRTEAERQRIAAWRSRLDAANAAMGARLDVLGAQKNRLNARQKELDAEKARLSTAGTQLHATRQPAGTAKGADTSH